MADKKKAKVSKKAEEDLVSVLAHKDTEFKRDQGSEGEAWHVTSEELRDGLRFVDMTKHAIPLKK